MDWTPIIGRHRPVEQDALRLLTIVHQLGHDDGDGRLIDGEQQLQQLDHLVSHPLDLAYAVMDQVRQTPPESSTESSDLAERVRALLGGSRRSRRHLALLRGFDLGTWERRDDVVAYLGCRGLLRTEPLPTHELRYRLTRHGARWLEEHVYPAGDGQQPIRERCWLLRSVLPDQLLNRSADSGLEAHLKETARRLDAFQDDEQIGAGDELAARLFRATFQEQL